MYMNNILPLSTCGKQIDVFYKSLILSSKNAEICIDHARLPSHDLASSATI